jgi:retinol dehydrogenase-12
LSTIDRSSEEKHVRIVTVSSGAHHGSSIVYDTLLDGPIRKKKSPGVLYAQSKFGGIVLAKELARRYGDAGIVSVSLNPGNITTNLQREIPSGSKKLIVSSLWVHEEYI